MRARGQLNLNLALGQQVLQIAELQSDDLFDVLFAERVEDHNLIDAVQELGPEVFEQRLVDALFALPEQRSAPPHVPSADESPTSWRSLESFHHHARTRVESARIAPPWLSYPPGPSLRAVKPEAESTVYGFQSGGAKSKYRMGPNQSIEITSFRFVSRCSSTKSIT